MFYRLYITRFGVEKLIGTYYNMRDCLTYIPNEFVMHQGYTIRIEVVALGESVGIDAMY